MRSKVVHYPDIYACVVTPPNKHGFCNFSYQVWYSPGVVRTAKTVIAEVRPDLIWTYGDLVHVSELDYLIAASPPETPSIVAPPTAGDEIPKADVLGTYVADLIRDGDTLQVGIGAASEAMALHLHTKNDLGIDSEMVYTWMIDLVKAGVITGKRKNINKGKVITSAMVKYPGDPRNEAALDFLDQNPMFEFRDFAYIGNPVRFGQNDNLVAVNNILGIDLLGQATVDYLGPHRISGYGGQPEWTFGSHYSRGGRTISTLISTAMGGKVSRIVPHFEPGTGIAIPMGFIDFLVTEHGVVNLELKTRRERAEAIISVADPMFRDELRKEAKKRFGL